MKLDLGTLLFLSLGLAMDAFVVSVGNSMTVAGLKRHHIVLAAALYGLFQGLMPAAGYFAGWYFAAYVHKWSDLVAFFILSALGSKMIWECLKARKEPGACPKTPFSLRLVLVQAVGTSIDALAVGVGFAVLNLNIWYACVVIALVTFACCLAGGFLGNRIGMLVGDRAGIFGGGTLIAIGAKILLEGCL